MPYVLVEDFRGGLDNRRTVVTSVPGSLTTLNNAHITRGGEIEKRKAFVKIADLPANTFGLKASNGQIYIFGSQESVSFASGTPGNINYIRNQHPTDANISTSSNTVPMTELLDADFFDGKVYSSARYADGRIYHYWEGQTSTEDGTAIPETRITDWFDARSRSSFTITGGSATSSSGTAATGSFQVTDGTSNAGDNVRTVTVNGVRLWSDVTTIPHTGDNNTTAANVASAINAFTSTPNYTASASTNTVTITADDKGTSANGFVVAATVDGQVTVGSIVNMSGGVNNAISDITVNSKSIIDNPVLWTTSNDATAALVAQAINDSASSPEIEATAVGAKVNVITRESGTETTLFGAASVPVVISKTGDVTASTAANMSGGAPNSVTAYTPGAFVLAHKQSMMSLSDSLWHYSDVKKPYEWNSTGTYNPPAGNLGSGFTNLSNTNRGSEELIAIAPYFNNLAIFAENAIQVWFWDPDPASHQQVQILNNTGTFAQNSVQEFGDSDVFYLNESGIRSLKARDSSNSAFVGDIGNPIDDEVQTLIKADRNAAKSAQAIMDPREGRYMIAIGSKVYVFSFFPSSKISAWSTYEPGFTISAWAYDGSQILCRSGNELYSLGGANNDTYDTTTVTVQMPFLDGGKPATSKDWTGLDAVCVNDWEVYMGTDPTDINTNEQVGVINKTTYGMGRIPVTGYSTHVAIKMVCNSKQGAAKIGNVALHYEGADAG